MTVDVLVMAHPKRADQAEKLAADVNARIVWDQRDDEWDTGSRAWAAADPSTDWACVLQDDALPVADFRRHLTDVLEVAPRTAVGLYVGTGRPYPDRVTCAVAEADRVDAAWLGCDGLLWGVAVALPVDHITPMLEWASSSRLPYDQRIGAWYRLQHHRVLYCWPSLVDHADGPRLVTTSGPPTCARRAHRVGEPQWRNSLVVRI